MVFAGFGDYFVEALLERKRLCCSRTPNNSRTFSRGASRNASKNCVVLWGTLGQPISPSLRLRRAACSRVRAAFSGNGQTSLAGFCRRLAAREGKPYRLPTEAEWEYACRSGTTTPFWFGETISSNQVNYDGNYPYDKGEKGQFRQETTPVGTFPANAWGLYDMHGNIWEWCQDWYAPYAQSNSRDPQGGRNGEERVLRGGSWRVMAGNCRSAFRNRNAPDDADKHFGFRVCVCLD
jgi:hypothetical protein